MDERAQVLSENIITVAKLMPFWAGPIAIIQLADLKDIVTIMVGLIGMVCTILVTRHTIRKGKREKPPR